MKKKLDKIFLLVKIFSCESRFPRRTFVRRKTMSNSFSCHFVIFQKKKKDINTWGLSHLLSKSV